MTLAAVILAGGTARRLGGADKASLEHGGRTFLEHALAATAAAEETVVVGDPVATGRPVAFVREDPPLGGPVAGLLAGRHVLTGTPDRLAVLAVDMPWVTAATLARLEAAVGDHDGAVLVDAEGRRQLVWVVATARLDAVAPHPPTGTAVRSLLAPLDLVEVAAEGDEARGVDRWEDLRDTGHDNGVAARPPVRKPGLVNLHDWIDELCDALDIEAEVDEGLVLDLSRTAAHNVTKVAAPITAYLLGLAAGSQNASPDEIEELAARAQALADGWDRPADARDPVDVDDDVPDDSEVDHTDDDFEA